MNDNKLMMAVNVIDQTGTTKIAGIGLGCGFDGEFYSPWQIDKELQVQSLIFCLSEITLCEGN